MDIKEAIKRLKEARNTIQPFRYVDEAIDYVVKVLEQNPFITISEIPKDYDYDCDTRDFLVYRNRYTGDEMHIKRPTSLYVLDQDLCSACVNREAVHRQINEWVTMSCKTLLSLHKRIDTLPITPKAVIDGIARSGIASVFPCHRAKKASTGRARKFRRNTSVMGDTPSI